MSERLRKLKKTRVSVTMTRPYLDALDHLMEDGIYLSRGEVVLEGLRLLLGSRGMKPFARSLEEEQ